MESHGWGQELGSLLGSWQLGSSPYVWILSLSHRTSFSQHLSSLGCIAGLCLWFGEFSWLSPVHTPESSPLFCLIHYHGTCGAKPFTLGNFLDHLPGYSWTSQEWPFKWVQGCLSSISWCCFFLRRLWVGQLSHRDFSEKWWWPVWALICIFWLQSQEMMC